MSLNTNHFVQQIFVAAFSLCSTIIFPQTIITVTESNLHGWAKDEQYLGKIRFANGPSTPPLQKGSLEFDAPVNGHARHVRMRTDRYLGVLLSSITQLSYSTFVQKAGSTRDVPLLVLLVDADGDGIEDVHFSFVPRFQNPKDTTGFPTKFGWYKPKKTNEKAIRWQYPVLQKVWQTWDALHGGWVTWSMVENTVDTNPPMYSLSGFIAQHPNARIINDKHGGGVRIQAGGIPMADNFLGNADALTIGINGKTTIYDFELGKDTVRK